MRYDFEKDPKSVKIKKILKKTIIWIVEIVAVVLLAYFIVNFALERTRMLGSSMEVTLQEDDKIIIRKLAYWKREPKRFDIIVFKQSGSEHSYYNIKRVIGLPGETVQIIDGAVYINDKLLDEPMIVEPINIPGLAEEPVVLEDDEYFVLGDNRNNSEDSRFFNIGNIVRDDIIGKAWITLDPFEIINKMNMKSSLPEDETYKDTSNENTEITDENTEETSGERTDGSTQSDGATQSD